MSVQRISRVALPLLIASAAAAGLCLNAALSNARSPKAHNGVLDLSEWNKKGAFELSGEWEFYWGRALTDAQIESGGEAYEVVEAPGEWNGDETELGQLPGFGLATYRIRVTGAQVGEEYGLRVQNEASAYRLYVEGELIGQNGHFGDKSDAPVSEYRPQLGRFKAETDSFDIILQISNDAYAVGGMWEPVIFGTFRQVEDFDRALSNVGMFTFGGLAFICLFFLIFFAAQRKEKDTLILTSIGALIILRLTITGDMIATYLFPGMPLSRLGWIDYLTLIWMQFLLYYFVYCAYGGLARRWQIIGLLSYCAAVSLCLVLLPFEVVTGAYAALNFILLFIVAFVTAQLARAAWRGQEGAPALLGAMALVSLLMAYDMFYGVWPTWYYLLTATSIDYLTLFVAYCAVVALRYKRSRQMEVTLLKNQIRPHFIHNSLACIIGISRTDAGRARDLLTDFSSYLRGYYDYDIQEQITLGQELELIRAYAALEQARFGERFTVMYDIESESLLVPPLCLQPLVENAFVHGLREKEDGGTVLVYAKRTAKGRVLIGVRDNGVGLRKKHNSERGGVGIENINRRLSRLYRTQLRFSVPEGGGCEVSMELPWKEDPLCARSSLTTSSHA